MSSGLDGSPSSGSGRSFLERDFFDLELDMVGGSGMVSTQIDQKNRWKRWDIPLICLLVEADVERLEVFF
jgi:hypothetical protein